MRVLVKVWPEVIKGEDGNIRSVETCYDIDLDISPDDVRMLDEPAQEAYSDFVRKKLQQLLKTKEGR